MKVVKDHGCFSYVDRMYQEDLSFIVAAANIAGYLESNERIYVQDDDELAMAVLELVLEYDRVSEDSNCAKFHLFASYWLITRFPIEV